MNEKQLLFLEKKDDFERIAELIKFKLEIGLRLQSARYCYEVKTWATDPTKTWVDEWLEIKSAGYLYKVNVCANSQMANERQLLAVLAFPESICGLISKEAV